MRIDRLLAAIALTLSSGCALTPIERSTRPESILTPPVVVHLPFPVPKETPTLGETADRTADADIAQVFPIEILAVSEAVASDLITDKAIVAPAPQLPRPPVDIWDRLRRGFAMPRLNSAVSEQFARHFATTTFLTKTEARARRYLYYFLEEIERRGLPTELALLPFVESSMNPHARSGVGAVGAWQFMPATGRRFDMRVSHLVDDRKSVSESTRGAMDYLKELYARFGDWHLALASYNWGENAVARAIERNNLRGLPADYLSLSMPRETRNYVPQLEALKRLILDPAGYGATLPAIPNRPHFVDVQVHRDMDVDLVLRLADIPEAEFFALNASVKRPLLIAAATPKLLLPHDNAARFEARLATHRGPTASWTAIRVAENERLDTIARRAGINTRELRKINNIPPGMKPTTGSTLIVPIAARSPVAVSESLVDGAYLRLSPELVRTTARARKGDTLSRLAVRLRLDVADLVRWNAGISPKTRLKVGQRITVYVHADFGRHRTGRSPGRNLTVAARMG